MIDEIWAGCAAQMRDVGWVENEHDEAIARCAFYTCAFMMMEALPRLSKDGLKELERDAQNWLKAGKSATYGIE